MRGRRAPPADRRGRIPETGTGRDRDGDPGAGAEAEAAAQNDSAPLYPTRGWGCPAPPLRVPGGARRAQPLPPAPAPGTPGFLPGEFHGQRSLVGYGPWGHKESEMTEQLNTVTQEVVYSAYLSFTFSQQWKT